MQLKKLRKRGNFAQKTTTKMFNTQRNYNFSKQYKFTERDQKRKKWYLW